MLSKEEIDKLIEFVKEDNWQSETDPTECLDGNVYAEALTELLALQSLPEMAEVDALEAMFGGCVIADQRIHFESACELARQSIATAQAERLRADEARKCCPCNCHDQPSSEEAMGLKEHDNCGLCAKALMEESAALEEAAYKMFNEQIATLTAERDEARRLLKISMDANLSYHDLQVVLNDRSSLRLSILSQAEATRILELCNGGRDDA